MPAGCDLFGDVGCETETESETETVAVAESVSVSVSVSETVSVSVSEAERGAFNLGAPGRFVSVVSAERRTSRANPWRVGCA